jgi:hypothetical protein
MRMNIFRTSTFVLMLAGLPLIGACSQQPPAATAPDNMAKADTDKPHTLIGKTVAKEIDKARKELATGNISLNGHDVTINGHDYARTDDDNRPKAEITPQGDLLLDGKAVAITPQQRAMLLEYRGQIIAIADAGMTLGSKGAELAGKAIGESLGALFSGNTDEIEKRVEAEASKIEAEAKLLCKQLPPMLATQQKLAASLPQFKPYATMTQDDVDDCADDIDHKGVWATK